MYGSKLVTAQPDIVLFEVFLFRPTNGNRSLIQSLSVVADAYQYSLMNSHGLHPFLLIFSPIRSTLTFAGIAKLVRVLKVPHPWGRFRRCVAPRSPTSIF